MLPDVAHPARTQTLVIPSQAAELRRAYQVEVQRLRQPLDRRGIAGIEQVTIAEPEFGHLSLLAEVPSF